MRRRVGHHCGLQARAVNEVAFYIGSRNDDPDEGVYYFDEIAAVLVPAPSGQ